MITVGIGVGVGFPPDKSASGTVSPPLASDITVWLTNNAGISGNPVDSWTDQLHGLVFPQTGTARPAVEVSGGGYTFVYFDGTNDSLNMPAGFSWDKQNSSVFLVVRSKTIPAGGSGGATSAIWHMATATDEDTVYVVNGNDLRLFNGGSQDSGLYLGDNITTVYRVANGATNVRMGCNNQNATVSANPAGTTTPGGYIGVWSGGGGGNFNFVGDVIAVIAYGRTLTPTETQSVQDFCTTTYQASSRTYNKVLVPVGDSLTEGVTSDPPDYVLERYVSYPFQLAQLQTSNPIYVNCGHGGAQINPAAGNYIGTTETVNALTVSFAGIGTRTVMLWIGTNDISNGRLAVQVEGDITSWISTVKAADPGCKICLSTIISRGPFNVGQEAIRLAVNLFITTTGCGQDYTYDAAANPIFQNPANTTYYYTDQIHLMPAGYAVYASGLNTILVANSRI